MNRVTVVVPIYGHWESLKACIDSLVSFAPPEYFDILLVNDCGPEANEIEKKILRAIKSHPQFRYERNPHNLGFVKTCNRAVFELDKTDNDILLLNSDTQITKGSLLEMRDLLNAAEHHGVVCPRSNDATIASLPFLKLQPGTYNSIERTQEVFNQLGNDLPRYYISPVSVGFCFLTKRSLIRNYGLFDEVYGRGYNEENDYCIRINELGYSSLIANHALVFHIGGASFGAETKSELDQINGRILNERYPYYPHGVVQFIEHGYSAVDRFADLLTKPKSLPPKILVDLNHISLVMNGSTRNALSFLDLLSSFSRDERSHITIAAQPEAIAEFSLENFGIRVVPYLELNELFDVGVSISPVTTLRQLYTLNRFCAKWVVIHLDIITLRAMYLDVQVPHKSMVIKKALELADKVIAISQSSLNDAIAFYQDPDLFTNNASVLHQGAENQFFTPTTQRQSSLPEPGYVLLLGNAFKHKQTEPALVELSKTGHRIVCLSGLDHKDKFPDIEFVESGTQSDTTILSLMDGASAIVFPSVYEGFGLPLVEAAARKIPIIAFNTETTREVIQSLELRNVILITQLNQINVAISQAFALSSESESAPPRRLSEYNKAVWQEVINISHSAISKEHLNHRDAEIRSMTLVGLPLENKERYATNTLKDFRNLRSYKLAELIASTAQPIRVLKNKIWR